MEIKHYTRLNDFSLVASVGKLLEEEMESSLGLSCDQDETAQIAYAQAEGRPGCIAQYSKLFDREVLTLTDEGELVGFLFYASDALCPELGRRRRCVIDVLMVRKEYRGMRMAYELLFALFARVTLSGQAVVAKVWSTNLKYVHILEQMGFRCVRKVADDAGQDIDLLFYEKNFNSRQAGVIKRLSACHALASAIASIVLFSVAVLSVVGFVAFRQCSVVASELFLALATSLTASSICILVETVHRLNSAEADRFLIDMKELGIERLSFNKQELLFDAIRNARKTIWISGYRHIITSGLRAEIQSALRRGVDVRILSSAPWKKSYKQIYGNDMSVIKSYIKIAELILCGNSCSSAQGQCLIRYSSKVHFNDIYRIDNTFITSPYFYAGSRLDCGSGGIATARDFFTVVVSNESDLWHLTENEFDRLWQSAEEELDQDSFTLHFSDRAYTRRRDKDNCKLLRDCLKKRQ